MDLVGELYKHHLIRTWKRDRPEGWELTSGEWSPFYFMFREVPSFPDLFRYSVDELVSLVRGIQRTSPIDLLVGVASTGIPLAAGVALQLSLPMAFTRKVAGLRTVDDLRSNSAAWGDHSLVEGHFENGMRYLLVDDVVTGGASKDLSRRQVEMEAQMRGLTLVFAGTAVVVDRGYPAFDNSSKGVFAAHRLYDELDQIRNYGGSQAEAAVTRQYLETPQRFQNPITRAALLNGPDRVGDV